MEGYVVRSLDNNSRGRAERLGDLIGEVGVIEADIRDPHAVRQAVRGVDCVIHLASINGTEHFYNHPELVLDVGVRGILNVVSACRDEGIRELIVASSSEVYQTPPSVPTDETAPLSIPDVLNPRYSYAGAKVISELIAINYGRTEFERVCVFRPHNVYGPDMGWQHVIPQFIMRALDAVNSTPSGKLSFPIQGDGTQTRAFIFIDDFIDGLISVIECGEHLNVYHIGNPEEISITTVAREVLAYFGREVDIIPGPAPAGATQRRSPDISKVEALGFHPRVSFKSGLPPVADWYVNNAHLLPQAEMAEYYRQVDTP